MGMLPARVAGLPLVRAAVLLLFATLVATPSWADEACHKGESQNASAVSEAAPDGDDANRAQKRNRRAKKKAGNASEANQAAVAKAAKAANVQWGDYKRAVLVSWDGVRRDTLMELLERTDVSVPCWDNGDVFPVPTGRTNAQGQAIYTCLPALGGAKPADAPAESPAYAPYQVLPSHTTNDGTTMTKPQHASMLTGLNAETHGLVGNKTKGPMDEGLTIFELMMNQFDPLDSAGDRNGLIFRTHMSSDRKYVGRAIYRYAKRNDALQKATGHGNGFGTRPGPLKHALKSFDRWERDAERYSISEINFFVFLHFKTTDWSGHRNGEGSRAYRRVITETDRKLYTLMEWLRERGWGDAAIILSTDHGFHKAHHTRDAGWMVFNTFTAAYNVTLDTSHVPIRTLEDYCNSYSKPEQCMEDGPDIPMPPEDAVPNLYVTSITPTLLDMFGIDYSGAGIEGVSLYTD